MMLHVWMLVTRCFAIPIMGLIWVMHRRMGADPKRFSERLGRGGSGDDESVIWFHAASLGEVMQIAPLAQHLIKSCKTKILVTTTTDAGANWAAQKMPYVTHRFAPIDTPRATRRFLDSWSISAAIFVEGDLWPRLLHDLHQRGVPRILLNARNSRTRTRFPTVFAALLSSFSLVTCRSKAVARGVAALGLASHRVHVLPDLRLTQPRLPVSGEDLTQLSRAVGTRPVWLAASTHRADEAAVLTAHQEVLEAFPNALLIIAPRHPKRGLALQKLTQSRTLGTSRRSQGEDISNKTQVYIADTLGELGVFFSLCPISFLGGSLGDEGGHNPYEPICFETALVSGSRVKNFAEAYEMLAEEGAAEIVVDAANLGSTIKRLLRGNEAKAIGRAGLAFSAEAQDSTVICADLIMGAMERTA